MSLTKISYSMINGAPANLLDFVTGGAGTSVDPWTGWDTAFAANTSLKNWSIPNGYFSYSTPLVFDSSANGQTYRDLQLIGSGQSVFQFTGTGVAVSILGNINIGVKMSIENLFIRGNPNCTNIFQAQYLFKSTIKNLKLEEGTGNAFQINFGISCVFENIHISGLDVGIMITRPANGIYLQGTTTDCTFINPIIEGVVTTGIRIVEQSGSNVFIGGTSEAGSNSNKNNYGIQIDAACERNTFINVFCEDNAIADIEDLGFNTTWQNCTGFSLGASSTYGLHLIGNSDSGTAQAGGASTITLASGASATDNIYNNHQIQITGGTASGQTGIVLSYVGATKIATMKKPWSVQPDATSTYVTKGSRNALVLGGMYEYVKIDVGVFYATAINTIYNRVSTTGTFVNSATTTYMINVTNFITGAITTQGAVTITAASGQSTVTTNVGVFENLGREIFVTFSITNGSGGTGGTDALFSGLPVNVTNNGYDGGPVVSTNCATSKNLMFVPVVNTATFNIFNLTTGLNLTNTEAASGIFKGWIKIRY